MHRRLDPVTGLMVLDGESVPSQVRNSITADIAEVNNKIQVFYPLGAAGTVPTSTGSGSVTWEPKNQFGINISFDNGSFDYAIDASLQTADRTAVLPDRDGTFAFSADSFSGIDFGSISGNPSAVQNGQAWYDTAVNQFKFRQNAATIALSTMAGQDASNVSITGGSVSGLSSLSAGTVTASTSATVTANTASTSTTTGSLVVTGGVGIGGAVFAGANSSFNGVAIGRGGSNISTSTAVGGGSLNSASAGASCAAFGFSALQVSTGGENSAFGRNCLVANTSAIQNSAFGSFAGSNLSGGSLASSYNSFFGSRAGQLDATGANFASGSNNTLIGNDARCALTGQNNQIVIGSTARGDGSDTTVIGTSSTISTRLPGGKFIVSSAASDSITTSGGIIASGAVSFTSTTASTSTTTGALVVTGGVGIGGAVNTGADCVINGLRLGRGVGNATTNVAFGLNAGNSILTGTPSSQEVAIGNVALATAHSGSGNCAVGSNSMQFLSGSSSASNTSIGTSSLFNIATSSNDNVAAGANAGRYAGTGTAGTNTLCSTSVFIGTASRPAASGQTNQVVIGGLNAIGDGSNTTVIGTASTTQSRIFGGNALTTGANGQSTQLGQSTTASPTPTTSGATVTVAGLIPANSIVIGVTARVTTEITGATSFDIGDGTTANLFGDDVAVALNTTSNNTIAPTRYATATNVVLTANGGNFTAGAVRLTVHFLTLVAPTS